MAAALVTVTLAACSSQTSDKASNSGSADQRAPAPAAGPATSGEAASGSTDRSFAGSVVPAQRAIIRTAQLVVRVEDVAQAAAAAAARTTAAQGLVSDEQIGGGEQTDARSSEKAPAPPKGQATLTLRVPSDQLDPVVRDLVALGTQVSQNRQQSDVTAQVVDVESRIATQRASLQRLRTLMSKATSVGDIVQIEGELTRREADLESMLAQQKNLADQTTLATINLTLLGPDTAAPVQGDERGFLVGLRNGWHGLTGLLAVLVTVVGALLPFAVLATLVGLPVLVVLRRRRRPRAAPAGPPAPQAPAS